MATFGAPTLPATPHGSATPNRDELMQVIEDTTMLHLITDEGPQPYRSRAGIVVIVPGEPDTAPKG